MAVTQTESTKENDKIIREKKGGRSQGTLPLVEWFVPVTLMLSNKGVCVCVCARVRTRAMHVHAESVSLMVH